MVADFQYKPLFENLLEHRAAVVKRGFVRPHSGQPRNLAKTGAIFEGLVLSPFHRLVDVASKHRLNDTKVEETGLAAHGRGGGHRLRPGHHVHGAANPGCSRLSAGDCGSEDSHTARHSRLKGGCGQDCPPHNKCRMPRPGKVCGIGRRSRRPLPQSVDGDPREQLGIKVGGLLGHHPARERRSGHLLH